MSRKTTAPKRVHKMGKQCGYHTDGNRFWPALTYADPLRAIQTERNALSDYVLAMNKHLHALFLRLRQREDDIVRRACEDIGIDHERFVYYYDDGRFEPRTKDEPGEAPDE